MNVFILGRRIKYSTVSSYSNVSTSTEKKPIQYSSCSPIIQIMQTPTTEKGIRKHDGRKSVELFMTREFCYSVLDGGNDDDFMKNTYFGIINAKNISLPFHALALIYIIPTFVVRFSFDEKCHSFTWTMLQSCKAYHGYFYSTHEKSVQLFMSFVII